jgi:hypothetical protein
MFGKPFRLIALNMIASNHFASGRREVKNIPVNCRESFYEALVNDEDYEFLSQFRWRASARRTVIYANASVWTEVGYKSVEMHRMVIGDVEADWNVTLGGWPLEVRLDNGKTIYIIPQKYSRFREKSVDHIDGNGLNNTRANLRHLSCAEQVKNRRFR